MPRLLIGNAKEEFVPNDPEINFLVSYWSMMILWHVEAHDILVVPMKPADGHLEYICKLKEVDFRSVRVIVAPEGHGAHLSADRIANVKLKDLILRVLDGRNLKSILPVSHDTAVPKLARFLGNESALPGGQFALQGGGALSNSKSIFRAMAAGAGVPIPDGFVAHDSKDLEECLSDMLLKQKVDVIVKRDFGQSGRSNEVLSLKEGVIPNGARRGLVIKDTNAIQAYVQESWQWLTRSLGHPVIVERFYQDSVAIFAEFNVTDSQIECAGLGEMLARPMADGQVIPPVGVSSTNLAKIVDSGHLLCSSMQKFGYRGVVSADAIITPDGKVLFTEYNGRLTGSTHIYASVGAKIVGKEWMQKRILQERRGWSCSSFQNAVDMLISSRLAYDPETRKGVVLTGTHLPKRNTISYTVVAESLVEAAEIEKRLHEVSPRNI